MRKHSFGRGAAAMLLSAALLLVLCLGGCAEKDGELTVVNLNEVAHSIFYAPQYVAMEQSFFAEEGLEINLSLGNGADKSMTALISGDADIALMGAEAMLYVYNEGREDYAMSFAQLTQRAGNFIVSRENEEDFTWENTRGKTIIGGRAGGMPQMVLEYVLEQNGLIPGVDVEVLTNLQFSTTAGAFAGGIGDYTVEFDPSALNIEKAGAGYVVESLGTESGYIPYTVYMATKSYMADHGDIIQSFTNAIYRGQQWVDAHSSAEIAEAISPYFTENDLDDLTFMIERYKAQGTWRADPVFSAEGFELIQDIMENSGELSARVPFGDIVDNNWAEQAVK